jgi:diguanylate cyclase (GGDEF)-like protein/PAS domain S-box-containing protein
MFGYDIEDGITTDPMAFIHPDDLSIVLNVMNDLVQNPAYVPTIECRYKHKNGSYHWVESTYSNLLAEPSVQAVVINYRDINERKQADDALRESESKFHSVVSESADGIVLSDESGRIIEFNNAFEKITGQERETTLGRFLWDIQFQIMPRPARTDENYERAKDAVQKTLETGHASFLNKIVEVPFEHPDGTLRFIQQRGFLIHTETGWRLGSISRDVTERKQAEEDLRASEEKSKSLYQMLRLMTDNMPDLVWAKDMDGRYIFANKSMVEKLLIAQNTGEPIGKTDMYFAERQRAAHPENPNWHTFGELCLNTDEIILASQRAQRFEEFGNIKGEFLFLDVYKAPFLDELGNMIGTVGIGRNVTHEKKMEEERRQTQDALAASETELRALFTSMQDTVLVIDRDGVYQKIAPTNPGKFYIPPEEVVGKQLKDFFPVELAEKLLGLIQRVLETQETAQVEYEIIINEQSPWFEAFVSPMGADRTLWVARDISERKKIEAALIRSEQAYRTLFENMPIGLYRTLVDGSLLEVNPALINMFGYPDRSTLLERKAQDLYASPASNERFKAEISKKGTLSAFTSEFHRYDQQTFWAEDYVHTICDKAGNPLYYEGSLVNISERKQAEDKLRNANKSLEAAHCELQQMFAHEQVLARTDGLTSLYNRRYFFELASREFSATIRYQRPLTIILFDVDDFKQANDTFGHALGDTVLIQVAQTTATQVRDVDILARYGGDEFIILLPQTGTQQAFLIAERIRESVATMRLATDDSPFIVTLSIGVAETVHTPHDASIEDAIRRADKALYMAKQKGRNNTVIFTEP